MDSEHIKFDGEPPSRAVHKCPVHGKFVVETHGVVWKLRSCTFREPLNGAFPCGRLSPICNASDFLDDNSGSVRDLDSEVEKELRGAVKLSRTKSLEELCGTSNYRKSPEDKMKKYKQDLDRAAFEFAEREKMKQAMESFTLYEEK